MKNLLLISFVCILSCKAQDSSLVKKDQDFYLKSHELLDDALNKGKSTYCILKNFDFNNKHNLTESKLYNEIAYFHPSSFKELLSVEVARNNIERSKDSTGWVMFSHDNLLKEWNPLLFKKSKIIIVDALRKEFIYTENGVTYFNIIPLQINFKDDLAMVLYKGAFGLELYAYQLIKEKWHVIGVANEYKPSPE